MIRIAEHRVRSVDTIQSLAVQYLGRAEKWRDIVDFNNLDYPYLTADPLFKKSVPASGVLTVTRTYTVSELIIPEGTIFISPTSDGLPPREYASRATVTMPVGVATANIEVVCRVAGIWGNVPSYAITDIQSADTALSGAFSDIRNVESFSNGITLNVRMLGDSLLIPVDGEWDGEETYTDIDSFYEIYFGSDLALDDDGLIVFDGYGDVGRVAGMSNLMQAVQARLVTPKVSLVYHPEYGSILDQITAGGVTSYTKQWAALAITETLLADDRISAVNVVSVDIAGPVMNVLVDITPLNKGDAVRVPARISNILM